MARMKLNLDDLKVQSFTTTPGGVGGKIRGYDNTDETDCWGQCHGTAGTCPATQPSPTCYGTQCGTYGCTPNTACVEYDTCGNDTCWTGCTDYTNCDPECEE